MSAMPTLPAPASCNWMLPSAALPTDCTFALISVAALTAALLALDVLVPDPLPFIDEIVLALGTMLLASWRRRTRDPHDAH
jgi:hypothetical protein